MLLHSGHTRDTGGPNNIRWKFKMAAADVLILFIGHISVANEDISVKFGRRIDIGHVRVTVAQHPTFGKT